MRTLIPAALRGVVVVAGLVSFATPGFGQDKQVAVTYHLIQANQEWQGTGIFVTPGEMVCARASGLWTHGVQGIQQIIPYYGPKGFGKDEVGLVPEVVARTGALLGRIGGNGAFLIEDFLCFVPVGAGELYMQMNDRPGAFGNNAGTMKVQVTIQPVS